jgi:chitinase
MFSRCVPGRAIVPTMLVWLGCATATHQGTTNDAGPDSAPATADAATDATTTTSGWMIGYYAGYNNAALPVANIDWTSITHLAIAFYPPDGHDGLDQSLQLGAGQGPALTTALVAAAHANRVKAIASIGGSTEHSALAASASSSHRAAFVSNIASFVTSNGFDGIDLDWEPIESGDVTTLSALLGDLRTALPGITISLPIIPFNMNNPPDMSMFSTLLPQVDQINVMSYDMSSANTSWESWHSSPLHWNQNNDTPVGIDATVDALLGGGVPASKLGIGAGFLGQCYSKPITKPLQAVKSTTTITAIDYSDIASNYLPVTTAQWDSAAMVPYLSFTTPQAPDDCTYITYEDVQSLTAKANYAKTKGLGGIIVWTLNQGYVASAPAGQQNQLLDALWNGFMH